MECANEFVSRKTLPEFIEKLGKTFSNPVLTADRESTGYNQMVKNIDYLFQKTGLEKEGLKLMKELAYDTRYDTIQEAMVGKLGSLIKSTNKKIKINDARLLVKNAVRKGNQGKSTARIIDVFFQVPK